MSTHLGDALFRKECTFTLAASKPSHFPVSEMPEVAFAGRSNVGKSSLINGLTFRRKLARSSNTPGRTQEIIFFNLAEALFLVDLPGYGYAQASKTKQHAWGKLIDGYLCGRPALRRVCVLIDSRRGLMDVDRETMDLLDRAGVSYTIVLTKVDKIKKTELQETIKLIEEELKRHPAALPNVFPTSAEKKLGMEELRDYLASFL